MLQSTHMKGYTNLFIYATKDLLESFNTNSKEYNIINHYHSQFFKIMVCHNFTSYYHNVGCEF